MTSVESSGTYSDWAKNINDMAEDIHALNDRWWRNLETGERYERNKGELIALIHSELSEALEADRKDLMDDKLPHRHGLEVELADAVIRILDMAGGYGLDIGGALAEKLEFNARREDHKTENRKRKHGAKY